MEKYLPILRSSPFFKGLNDNEILSILHCVNATVISKERDSSIFRAGDSTELMGLAASGCVLVIQEDLWGHRNILSKCHAGDFFGEPYAARPGAVLNISVVADEDCEIKKLQMRIAKAVKENRVGKIKSLQWTLTHSFYAKAIAVKRVTENKGKRTPGVDGVCWISNEDKFNAIFTLQRRGYQPQPLRRIYIPKKNGKKRPLSIPTMKDRAMQTLHKMALEPVTETLADGTSYGFRPNRCVQDAIEQCFVDLARKTAPEWVLEGDIKGCFDNINHEWMQKNIPMDKEILHKFLKAGFVEKGKLNATDQGTPQGGTISPTLCNYVLDGLERLLKNKFKRYWSKGRQINPKVNLVRYADDFIITGASEELLRNEVLPLVKEFMHERGLELSDEKTVITNIHDGFDFLGCNIRKYGDKLLTKPSKQNVKSIMRKIRGTIKKFRTGKQSDLIKCLNPIIRGWVNFQKYNVSSVAFRYVDWQTFKALWRWCRRRHKNKPAAWIRDKYFHRIGNRSWTFSEKLTEDNYLALVYATDTNITRFTRIKAEANPYDEIWMEYFAERKNKSYSNFKFVYE